MSRQNVGIRQRHLVQTLWLLQSGEWGVREAVRLISAVRSSGHPRRLPPTPPLRNLAAPRLAAFVRTMVRGIGPERPGYALHKDPLPDLRSVDVLHVE